MQSALTNIFHLYIILSQGDTIKLQILWNAATTHEKWISFLNHFPKQSLNGWTYIEKKLHETFRSLNLSFVP